MEEDVNGLKTGLAVVSLVLAAAAAEAKVVHLECAFDFDDDIYAPLVRIDIDEANGSARVDSKLTQALAGGPVAGKVFDSAGRRTVRWTLEMQNKRAQRTRLMYSLVLFADGRQPMLHAKPYGFSNDYSEKGTCTQVKG
jgi:hypothetical protein